MLNQMGYVPKKSTSRRRAESGAGIGGILKYLKAVLVGLGLAQLATLITTIYLPRVLSHKAIRRHPALTIFMRVGTWMLTSISPREWVAVHRKHHNFSDVEGDLHSPHIEGYWQIMLVNV